MSSIGERRSATPEEVWALLREVVESQKETDRRMKETDRRMKETDRQMKETDRRLRKAEGLFTSPWGKLMESLVDGDLIALLQSRGIEVSRTLKNLHENYADRRWEIDILALNGHEVVAVEVKTTLRSEDVHVFLDFLNDFRELAPEYRNHTVYGAVAHLTADETVTAFAERKGLFVIRATGSSASITNRADFRPREFGIAGGDSAPM